MLNFLLQIGILLNGLNDVSNVPSHVIFLGSKVRIDEPSQLILWSNLTICKKTALVKHIVKFDHKINWLGSSILTFEPDFYKRRFLESYFIQKTNSSINDKEGVYYNEIYNELN